MQLNVGFRKTVFTSILALGILVSLDAQAMRCASGYTHESTSGWVENCFSKCPAGTPYSGATHSSYSNDGSAWYQDCYTGESSFSPAPSQARMINKSTKNPIAHFKLFNN